MSTPSFRDFLFAPDHPRVAVIRGLDAREYAEAAKADAILDAQTAAYFLEVRHHLQGAEGIQHGIEHGQEHQQDIVIEVKLAVVRLVPIAADGVEVAEQFRDLAELLKTLELLGIDRSTMIHRRGHGG